jgi:hypothetical protein
MKNRNRIFTFVVIVAFAMGCGFSVPAATEESVGGESASEKSSPATEEKSEETVPREFLGMADVSQFRGVIDDPDGYVNLRKEKRADAPVITKVKAGEPFQFNKREGEDWCQVKLKSGVSGWMHCSRIKLYFIKGDLPDTPDENGDIDKQAREHGVTFYEVAQGAARGEGKPLKTFLRIGEYADGAGAEEYWGVLSVVVHLVGDDALAKFLRVQSREFQEIARNSLNGDLTFPFAHDEYFRQHFPKTAKILFSEEGLNARPRLFTLPNHFLQRLQGG